jgi:two-component system, OmpR family, sensor histidine kinase QseC
VPSEIRPLVESFNDALRRLEQAFARQIQFLADAAHELKTPLALLRAQVELGSPDLAALERDIAQLSRQVQQMLVLAEVSESRGYRNDLVDVKTEAAAVCRMLAPMASRQGVQLKVRGQTDPAPLNADRSALQVLLKNLVENAISVAPPGTEVCVDVNADSLSVIDSGPGIAPDHLPHLFTRYWRAPHRHDTGAGLGLAICQAVAQAHRWHLRVRSLQPGTAFTLRFQPPTKDTLA